MFTRCSDRAQLFSRKDYFCFTHVYTKSCTFWLFFHIPNFSTNLSNVSAINARPSAWRSSHGQPVQNSVDNASRAITNSGLKTEPWWTPTLISVTSLYEPLTLILLFALFYIASTIAIIHLGTPTTHMANHSTRCGFLSKVFFQGQQKQDRVFDLHAGVFLGIVSEIRRALVVLPPDIAKLHAISIYAISSDFFDDSPYNFHRLIYKLQAMVVPSF